MLETWRIATMALIEQSILTIFFFVLSICSLFVFTFSTLGLFVEDAPYHIAEIAIGAAWAGILCWLLIFLSHMPVV